MDLEATAGNHIHKYLVKTKRIRESSAFIALYAGRSKLEAPSRPAELNVRARLFKSQPVKEAIASIMTDIYKCLDLEQHKVARPQDPVKLSLARRMASSTGSDREEDYSSESNQSLKRRDMDLQHRPQLMSDAMRNSDTGSGIECDPPELAEEEQAIDDPATRMSPLAPPSPSSSRPTSPHMSLCAENSPNPIATAVDTKPKSTTFLPSLTMGGYWSGSESDVENGNTNVVAPATKKNRKGQQERRAIAEKKFGVNANHLKGRRRDGGWDAKKGATESKGMVARKGKDRASFGTGRGRGGTRFSEAYRLGDKARHFREGGVKPKDEGPLHPSWEAAKKAKEQKPQSFAGKKVVFD